MKFILFLFCSFTYTFCIAQEFIDDDTKIITSNFFYNTSKYADLRHGYYNLKCDGGSCSYDKKYKKITYNIGSVAFYTPNTKYSKDFRKKGVYYQENDQLYFKPSLKTSNAIHEPTYHSNGNFYTGAVEDPEDPGLTRYIEMKADGFVVSDSPHRRPRYKFNKDEVYGLKAPVHQVKTPSTYETGSFRYYGFDDVAYLANDNSHKIFTGFVFPLTSYLTNGSVLYMEDKFTNKNYWAVILDNELKFKLEAPEKDAPDLFVLKENTVFNHYEFSGQVPYRFTKGLTNKYLSYHDQKHFELKTKNIVNHTGYGINLFTSDKQSVADEIFCEVGQFKNGKLHGVGLRSRLNKKYIAEFSWSTPSLALPKEDYITMDVSYGIFENGKAVNVKTINVEKMSPRNYWDVINIAGFKFKGGKPNGIYFEKSNADLSQLNYGNEIYIDEIGRTTKISELNKNKGYFTVHTDVRDIKAKFDSSYKKPLYLSNTVSYTIREDCHKTEKVPIYRKERKLLYTRPGTVKTSTRKVTGVYFDKIITSRISTPPQEIYGDVEVLDYYENRECPKCRGKGYLEVQKGHKEWRRIKLN